MSVLIHPFSYLIARKDSRPLKPHQRRDLGAALELMTALNELGFRMGEALLNNPPEQAPGPEDPDVELLAVDLSSVAPGDYLLQTTRPPLDDEEQGARKRVERGYTDVEARLFEVWRGYFEICSRLNVKLARPLWQEVLPEYANRRQIEFSEKAGAPYQRLNALDGSGRQAAPKGPLRTAAFFLRLEQAWDGGPGLMAAFGMDGTSTLAWAYRLARDYKGLLAEPGFTMVELSYDTIPTRATDLRWALDWEIEVVLSHDA